MDQSKILPTEESVENVNISCLRKLHLKMKCNLFRLL